MSGLGHTKWRGARAEAYATVLDDSSAVLAGLYNVVRMESGIRFFHFNFERETHASNICHGSGMLVGPGGLSVGLGR